MAGIQTDSATASDPILDPSLRRGDGKGRELTESTAQRAGAPLRAQATTLSIIPAKAGIQTDTAPDTAACLDPGLRRGDD